MTKFDIEKPIRDQLPKPDKNNGVIYYLYCNISKKGYIGQASNYVSGNTKWGAIGRWKSHMREATSGTKDHCLVLNNAIRKYGAEAFSVITVKEILLSELDQWESFYIETFNTLQPNGYNLEKGGRMNKIITKESRERMSAARKGKKRSLQVCKNISIAQLGNRRNVKKKRKFSEDSSLPKYIRRSRRNGKITGYSITYPIGIVQKEYIHQSFHNSQNPTEALKAAEKMFRRIKK